MSRTTYVYVIAEGERGEGHDPVAVATTLRRAKQIVFDRRDVEVSKVSPGTWMASWNPPTDEVWIRRLPLNGAMPS